MAISATLELIIPSANKYFDSKLASMLMDTYTVVDLDINLTRRILNNGKASTKASVDEFKITIRGTKEMKTPFYAWVNGGDDTNAWSNMSGIIHIYDSTGFFSSTIQDATGGVAPLGSDVVNDLVSEEIEDSLNYGMDHISDYGDRKGDIYDEMSKQDLISYIASKNIPVKVDKNDTDIILRKKIRAYDDYCKGLDNLTLEELTDKAEKQGYTIPTPKPSDEELEKKCKDYLKKKYSDSTEYGYYKQLDEIGRKDKNKTLDKLKSSTSKTASGTASGIITRVLDAARTIEFQNAVCLSMREHFQCNSKSSGQVDETYPWLMELTILPETITVSGASMFGLAKEGYQTKIDFYENMNNFPNLRHDKYHEFPNAPGQSVGTQPQQVPSSQPNPNPQAPQQPQQPQVPQQPQQP